MHIQIRNTIVVENPTEAIIDYIKENLIIDNPEYTQAIKLGRYAGHLAKKLYLYHNVGDVFYLPFGCIDDVWNKAPDVRLWENKIHPFLRNNLVGSINLYGYQENAKNALKSAKNGILEAPCGSGKTQVGLQLIKEIGGRALWLTHTKELLNQSRDRAKKYFEGDFGEITAGKVRIGKDITFATVQTMAKIDPELYRYEFDTIIVDECHHCVGTPTQFRQFYKVVNVCNARYKYGLSATLSRSDNLIGTLFKLIGPIRYTIQEQDVGDKIIKAKYEPVMINLPTDLRKYTDYDGTIVYNDLINYLSDDVQRNRIIIDNIAKNKGKKQLVLCHRVSHVEYLVAHIDGAIGVTGKVKDRSFDSDIIVATYALAKEGLDIPELDILHLATPQKNESVTKQAVGRIERNIEGKKQPICYDYVDANIGYCMGAFSKRRRFLSVKY